MSSLTTAPASATRYAGVGRASCWRMVSAAPTSRSATSTRRSAIATATICWDYRGLYTSSPPADPRANTMAHQVADLMTILERGAGRRLRDRRLVDGRAGRARDRAAAPDPREGRVRDQRNVRPRVPHGHGLAARRPDHPDAAAPRARAGGARRARHPAGRGLERADRRDEAGRHGLGDGGPRGVRCHRRRLPDDRLGHLQRSAHAARRARRRGRPPLGRRAAHDRHRRPRHHDAAVDGRAHPPRGPGQPPRS